MVSNEEARVAAKRRAWMATEPRWRNRVGKDWVAKKVLGQGSEGVVGWWQYQGTDKRERRLKNVAVKQAGLDPNRGKSGLQDEVGFYELFRTAKSQHIPKMYRRLYTDIGHNTMQPDVGHVERIFLEYCAGGDLWDFMEKRQRRNSRFEEREIWEIFHCLARSAHVLRYQSDHQKNPYGVEVCHFDTKPGNILVGEAATDTEHRHNPPVKEGQTLVDGTYLSDFGYSRRVPQVQGQDYIEKYQIWGTLIYMTPEQIQSRRAVEAAGTRPWFGRSPNVVALGAERRYGSASNVWCIGLVIWCLMRGHQCPPNWNTWQLFVGNSSQLLRNGGITLGQQRDIDEHFGRKGSHYSSKLRTVIQECLLIRPDKRIHVHDLLRATWEGVQEARLHGGAAGKPGVRYDPYIEPRLADRWYSGHRVPPASHDVKQEKAAREAAEMKMKAHLEAAEKAQREKVARAKMEAEIRTRKEREAKEALRLANKRKEAEIFLKQRQEAERLLKERRERLRQEEAKKAQLKRLEEAARRNQVRGDKQPAQVERLRRAAEDAERARRLAGAAPLQVEREKAMAAERIKAIPQKRQHEEREENNEALHRIRGVIFPGNRAGGQPKARMGLDRVAKPQVRSSPERERAKRNRAAALEARVPGGFIAGIRGNVRDALGQHRKMQQPGFDRDNNQRPQVRERELGALHPQRPQREMKLANEFNNLQIAQDEAVPRQIQVLRIQVNEGFDRNGRPVTWNKRFDRLTTNTTILQLKERIERNGKGIKARRMRLNHGATVMLNSQRLGDFSDLSDFLEAWTA